jgi:hypothetical protein
MRPLSFQSDSTSHLWVLKKREHPLVNTNLLSLCRSLTRQWTPAAQHHRGVWFWVPLALSGPPVTVVTPLGPSY